MGASAVCDQHPTVVCLCACVSGSVCVARHGGSKAELTEETAMDEGEASVQISRNDRSVSELGVLCLRNEVLCFVIFL